MSKLQLVLLFVILSVTSACNSRSNGKGQLEITLETSAYPGEAAPDMEKVSTVIKARMVALGFEEEDVTTVAIGNRIKVVLNHISAYPEIDRQRIRKVIQASAKLELWETYDMMDVLGNIQQGEKELADSLYGPQTDSLTERDPAKDHPILYLIQLNISSSGRDQHPIPGPVIGRVRTADTAQLMAFFHTNALRVALPPGLKLAWAKDDVMEKNHGGELVKLIALKRTASGKARMANPTVLNAVAHETDRSAGYTISVELNVPSGDAFEKLTKDNIGKAVAIVVDDFVYSYPNVQGAITGGKFEVTGNFSKPEAEDLAQILKSGTGTGPVLIRIVQEDLKQ